MALQRCPLKSDIFYRGGKMDLDRVKAIESHTSSNKYCGHLSLKKLVLNGYFNKTTPLLMACAEGDLVVVERIVEHWGVELNAAATYYHLRHEDNTNLKWNPGIDGATPLFVAAANGHDPVVRFLVGKGADISANTSGGFYSDMNPLQGALWVITDQYSEVQVSSALREKKTTVVRSLLEFGADPSALYLSYSPNWMTSLCKSNTTSIISLINSGMSLEQRNPNDGSSVLHYWAGNPLCRIVLESGTEEPSPLFVVKLLVEKGADLMALDKKGFSPILHAANQFQAQTSSEDFSIFDFLLEQDAIDRKEKIDALELLGAVILSDPNNAHLFQIAFDYWRRAMHLRQMETEGSAPFLKNVMKRKKGLTVEWATSNDLEHVAQHPSEYLIQAFLVKLRIFRSKSLEVVGSFLYFFFENMGSILQQQRKFAELLDIHWATLEMIISLQPQEKIRKTHHIEVTTSLPYQFVEVLSCLERGDPLMKTETYKTSLELILSSEKVYMLDGNQRGTNSYIHSRYMQALLRLVSVLALHPEMLNEENKVLFDDLVQLKRSTPHGRTLLHMACNNSQGCYGTISDFPTVCLLLKSGIDPNVGDLDGNGPLHLLFLLYTDIWGKTDDKWYSIARLLIDSGAHLDRVNNKGKTAADFWTEKGASWACNKVRLPDWCYEALPSRLTCLSSRVICSQKIHYTEETLPLFLHKFVKMH